MGQLAVLQVNLQPSLHGGTHDCNKVHLRWSIAMCQTRERDMLTCRLCDDAILASCCTRRTCRLSGGVMAVLHLCVIALEAATTQIQCCLLFPAPHRIVPQGHEDVQCLTLISSAGAAVEKLMDV